MNLTPIRKLVQRTRRCDPRELGRDSIVYIDIASIDRQTKHIAETQVIPVDEAPSRARKQVQAGDVLVSTVRPNLNSVAIVPREYHGEIASTGFCVLCAKKNKIDPTYLFYFTQTRGFVSRLTRLATGASYPAVSDDTVLDAEIPLPLLSEQQRIAAILGRADRLRRLRRTARELSDTYLQSVFLEMFGDPVTNLMGWDRAKVSDLGVIQTGNTPSRKDPENYGNHIEWIKSDNIIPDQLFVSKSEEMLSEKGLERGRSVETGSVLVTCIAGSPTSIGNVAMTDRKVSFNQQINAVTPHKGVEPLFLYGLFLAAKPFVQRSTTRAMKRMISKSKFGNLILIEPPRHLQQRFAHIVHKFERLRTQQREAERQAEHLFQALLHRAFRGEV